MIALSILLAGILHIGFAGPSDPAKVFKNEIGVGVGWGNPFGTLELEYWRHLTLQHEVGLGTGASSAGFHYGLGYKRYFLVEGRYNPWIGVSAYYSTGNIYATDDSLSNVFSGNGDNYRLKPGLVIHPRVGIRDQDGWVNLHLALGWGVPVFGGGAQFISPDPRTRDDRSARLHAIGGPEASLAVMVRI